MKKALEEAERKAKEEKIKQRLRHVNKEQCGNDRPTQPGPRCHSGDDATEDKGLGKEPKRIVNRSSEQYQRNEEKHRPDTITSRESVVTCRRFSEMDRTVESPPCNNDVDVQKCDHPDSGPRTVTSREVEAEQQRCCDRLAENNFSNPSEEFICQESSVRVGRSEDCGRIVERRDSICRTDANHESYRNVVSHRSYQSFSVVAAPRKDSPSPIRPLTPQDNHDVREMLAARKDSIDSRREPLEESVVRALEALKTCDPVVEIESTQLRLVATPDQGRLLTPSKYRPTRRTEKATQTDTK